MIELPRKGQSVSVQQLKILCIHYRKFDIYEKLISGKHPAGDAVSDGCSMWPDWVGADIYPACFWHDVRYWLGGTEEERKFADEQLRADVIAITGNEALGEFMYHGVRVGGRPGTGLPWEWGYGWKGAAA